MGEQVGNDDPIKALFDGVIPERVAEIMTLLSQHTAQFRAVEDSDGFDLKAGGFGAIQYTPRSMRQLWLFGYGGMLSLHSYASFIAILRALGQEFRISEIDAIPGQVEIDREFSELMAKIEELKSAFGEADFVWPENIPDPQDGRPPDVESAAVYDLTCIAVTYAFLHELKHIIFQSEGNAPADNREEEHECDAFAQEIILGRISTYCEQSGFPEAKVKMKRAMGIALASVFLLFATPRHLVGGSQTHPPVHGRWRSVVDGVDLNEDCYFWLYFSSMAISMLRFKRITMPQMGFSSYRHLSHELIQALENGI